MQLPKQVPKDILSQKICQESIQTENSLSTKRHPSLIKKYLQYLFYFTISFYLCQFVVGSLNLPRSILVGAKQIPTQENKILSNPSQNQFNQRRLEELQEEISHNNIERINPEDGLTSIVKLEGAEAIVVSKDGKRIFQFSLEPNNNPWSSNVFYKLIGMDISDPLAIKYSPSSTSTMKKGNCAKALALSSDANILFEVTCEFLTIYNVSDPTNFPNHLGYASFIEYTSMGSRGLQGLISVTLYEEENKLIIAADNKDVRIFNTKDLNKPTKEWFSKQDLFSGSVVFIPGQRKALVGGKEGLSVIDISDFENPVVIKTILKNESVISISLSADQSTAFVGVLNKTLAQNQTIEKDRSTWAGSLSIFKIDLKYFEPGSFIQIDQLKSCRVNNYMETIDYLIDVNPFSPKKNFN